MERRIAAVTGAGQGIGRAIAKRLAEDEFRVIVIDRNAAAADDTVAAIRQAGGEAESAAIDICDRGSVSALFQRQPSLDVVVNNAGIFTDRPFFDLTEADFDAAHKVNVVGLFVVAQEAARRMQPGGRIINIASRAFLGARGHAHYVASKAAVVGLTRAMAMELAGREIFVNAIAPGLIDTPMLQALSPDRLRQQLALQPTGKAGTPDDVANAVAFFASPRTGFITGQVLLVDGGKSLGGGLGI
jgi:Dehydrogenases with different specificities (related to short-chain alcohol dehydrogenases)